MKMITLVPIFLLCFTMTHAQHMQVTGKFLEDASGNKTILRGVNYPIMDDGNVDLNDPATYQSKIDEFAKTGANCIRIPWNTDGVHWRDQPEHGGVAGTMQGYIHNDKLGDFIAYCYEKNLVVVLEIHDITCQNDWLAFDNIVANFWLENEVLQLINTYSSKLILNIVNEFGYDNDWGGDMLTFKSKYITAIQDMRSAGIEVPIMIDAPNCGVASSSLVGIANDLLAVDDNLIFSVHTYWSVYAATEAAIDAKMEEMQDNAGCFVFGEIANKQDVGTCGDTDITPIYKRVLANACPMEMGWLAWSYHKDCTPAREITNDGTFAGLTTYGNDLVNNPDYGLKSTGSCSGSAGAATGIRATESGRSGIQVYPNPNNGLFFMNTKEQVKELRVYNGIGTSISVKKVAANQYELEHSLPGGIYWLQGILMNGTRFSQSVTCVR